MTGNAVTIGVFDGVHRGHQALLAAARATGLPVTALTFDPHPAAVLAPQGAPQLLCTVAERVALLEQYGADRVVVVPFDPTFATQSPAAFIDDILRRQLGTETVVVGEDFRFGQGRQGTLATLQAAGLSVVAVPPQSVGGVAARSTTIRQQVAAGEVALAAALLGRPYVLSGLVVHGRKLGRQIGYPTANLASDPTVLVPGAGVYAGRVQLADGRWQRAAISVGTNPTVTQNGPVTVEAFLLDGFDEDLYDQRLRVEFVHFLRGTIQFPGLEPLLVQMAQDVDETSRRIPL